MVAMRAVNLDRWVGQGQIRRNCERQNLVMKNLPSKKSFVLGTVVALLLLAFIYKVRCMVGNLCSY